MRETELSGKESVTWYVAAYQLKKGGSRAWVDNRTGLIDRYVIGQVKDAVFKAFKQFEESGAYNEGVNCWKVADRILR